MDMKYDFLNGYSQVEVYAEQALSFKDVEKPDYVYKLHKTLYILKQAPRAWY